MDRPERRNEAMSFARIHQHLNLSVKQGIDGPGNIKWVGEDQAVQSVVDSCPSPAADNLFEVIVPPGHEDESYIPEPYITVTRIGRRESTFTVASSTSLHKHTADFICDGTDDQVQIQLAINSLPGDGSDAGEGGSIVLLDGTFYLSAPIQLRGSMHLKGQGIYNTELKMATAADCNMFEYLGQVNVLFTVISDMFMNGNKVNQASGSCIVEGDATGHILDLNIRNVFIAYFKENGVTIYNGWGHRLDNAIIEFCDGHGLEITSSPNHIKILSCKLISNTKSGVRLIENATGKYGALIANSEINTLDTTGNYAGLYLEDSNVTVSGCIITAGGHATSYAVHIASGYYNNITGNVINGNSVSYCVYDESKKNIITGNSYKTWGTAPVYHGGWEPEVITGNNYQNMNIINWLDAATKTLEVADSGQTWGNFYNTGSVTITLPAAQKGLIFTFVKYRDQDFILQSTGDDTINDGSAGKIYKNVETEGGKASCTLIAVGLTNWIPLSVHGTWVNDNT